MEAHEIAETMEEAGEHGHEHAHPHMTDDAFRRRVGVFIGILACALAITSTGGSSAMKRTINANIETSDDYAFYQAKTIRQQVLDTAVNDLDALAASNPAMPIEAMTALRQRQDTYRKNIAHWEDAPETGDGRKQLLAKAKESEERRVRSSERDEWFEIAEAMLQIGVVIASTAILTASRRLLMLAGVLAVLGIVFSANGFTGFFEMVEAALPFGR